MTIEDLVKLLKSVHAEKRIFGWNEWVEIPHVQLYLRITKHFLHNEMVPCLDLSAIIVDQGSRGNGLFTVFLGDAEKAAAEMGRHVYVENVHEERFAEFFRKRGYTETRDAGDVPSFWRKA